MDTPDNVITAEMLYAARACLPAFDRFRATLGDSVEVTVETATEQCDAWDWHWAAWHLLTPSAADRWYEDKKKMTEEALASIDPVKAVWHRARRAAARVHLYVDVPDHEAYDRALRIAAAAYDSAARPIHKHIRRELAAMFAREVVAGNLQFDSRGNLKGG